MSQSVIIEGLEFYGVVDLLCRLVVDEWLELKFPSPEMGQDMLSAVQTLRSMWSHLLEMKLQASQCESSHIPVVKQLFIILWDSFEEKILLTG